MPAANRSSTTQRSVASFYFSPPSQIETIDIDHLHDQIPNYSSAMWQPNQTIKDGRFLIQKVLGGGGFGVAYRALDRDLDRLVVIKTLNQSQQNKADFDRQQAKFKQEAKTLSGLIHPHIVKVHDIIQENGLLGMVMEYIDGQELAEYVDSREKLTEQQALRYIKQVGEALVYTHSKGFFHRDIKPHNIMLRAGNLEAVLIDFGLAREFIDTKTLSITNARTPAYAPIEQYDRHGRFGAYTDVYALAATLYHLLTGEAPILSAIPRKEAQDKGQSIDRFLWDKIPEEVSDRTKQGIIKGMAVLPQNRPQSISEFLQLLGLGTPAVVSIQSPSISKPQPAASNLPKLTKIQFTSVTLDKQGKIIDRPSGSAEIFTEDLGKGVELIMVKIPAGKFLMGSPENEEGRARDESPQHQVNVPEFYFGQTLVTQAQYQAIMGNNPSSFKGNDKLPVEQVSWLEAMDFCQKLSKKNGRTYRLPSEAEWEYAARAGTTTPFAFGETITSEVVCYASGWNFFAKEYRKKPTPVGTFPPNLFGLYDMHGNVDEWCLDEWVDNYNDAPTDGSARGDIISISKNKKRLMRGGFFALSESLCRSATRSSDAASFRSWCIGFRVVRVPSSTA
jgi:formylglycine-generating enzyme required for sulfatase activity/predicted Ser/Thr protein kinase